MDGLESQASAIGANSFRSDAQRPCSTCLRSHNHAVTHAAPGVALPREPDCTYDESKSFIDMGSSHDLKDLQDQPATVNEVPKNRYERLETRIRKLP